MAHKKISVLDAEEYSRVYSNHCGADGSSVSVVPPYAQTAAQKHLNVAKYRRKGEECVGVVDQGHRSTIYVVTDDVPFLVGSVAMVLARYGAAIRNINHPVFVAYRSESTGELEYVQEIPENSYQDSLHTFSLPSLSGYLTEGASFSAVESWISIEVDVLQEGKQRDDILNAVHGALNDVKFAVRDWQKMQDRAVQAAAYIKAHSGANFISTSDGISPQNAEDFLLWLKNNHFTFLGYREYTLEKKGSRHVLVADLGSGLGLLSQDNLKYRQKYSQNSEGIPSHDAAAAYAGQNVAVRLLPPEVDRQAEEKTPLIITKANSRSMVRRPGYLDYIGVKTFDEQGRVTGEKRFIGLFGSSAYTNSVKTIPIVREKVAEVVKLLGFMANSHSGRGAMSILESYPRDELFQIGIPDLFATVQGIIGLEQRRETKTFVRTDAYSRFMSVLIYLPRDRYTTAVRERIEEQLRQTYDIESLIFEARVTESSLARLFFRALLKPQEAAKYNAKRANVEMLNKKIALATRSWSEALSVNLQESYSEDVAQQLIRRWRDAFPPGYRVEYNVHDALVDIAQFEEHFLSTDKKSDKYLTRLHKPSVLEREGENLRLLMYLEEPKALSTILPILSRLGIEVVEERPYVVTPDHKSYYLYDLGVQYPDNADPLATQELVSDAIAQIFEGKTESDYLDQLIIRERLTSRQVNILRAYLRYVRQMEVNFSFSLMTEVLINHSKLANLLVQMFERAFKPGAYDTLDQRQQAVEEVDSILLGEADKLNTLDEDRVIRLVRTLIFATVRTNYYQQHNYLSFKVAPELILSLPGRKPKFEVWVYSPRVEGVHLRFGAISRGGLRWSDRREDFRTEVLGLVKAQVLKNAVIVPSGAKGGFYAKKLPDINSGRQAWLAEGQEAYKIFIRGLLDLTDNVVMKEGRKTIVPPKDVFAYDEDDSYLVVAADKGTASFSDIANSISQEYGFWLGDAFASGGSDGYDHKAMGITARGAWESVKRHSIERGFDIRSREFTVVGVGDMSGDVFGNGMVLSDKIRLVAAFDHRHIFLDPAPDAARSFAERKRLFDLPRSSWADYDSSLLSQGGMIVSRSEKSVILSKEAMKALDTEVKVMSPSELLKIILQAPVDLLYNGGVGTYIKGSKESNAHVGDRANDPSRINGNQVRAAIVCEGGNLGSTQAGRVEAAQQGIIINTDAMDNSAGVDCSDHEVNIKILLDSLVRQNKLKESERAVFLAEMTGEVSSLVLSNNVDHNVLLLNEKVASLRAPQWYEQLMQWLERNVGLDRKSEVLPTTEEFESRVARGEGLTAPELAVLVAYTKIEFTKELNQAAPGAEGSVVEDPYAERLLVKYFPQQIQARFSQDIALHPLRRNIIATMIVNELVNLGGSTFILQIAEETNTTSDRVAKAFLIAKEFFHFEDLFHRLNALGADVQIEHWKKIHADMRRVLFRVTRWLVNHEDLSRNIDGIIKDYAQDLDTLRPLLSQLLSGKDAQRIEQEQEQAVRCNIPESLIHECVNLFESFGLLDVISIARETGVKQEYAAALYFTVYNRYNVDNLLQKVTRLPRSDPWSSLARSALRDDLYSTIAQLVDVILKSGDKQYVNGNGVKDYLVQAKQQVIEWEACHQDSIQRTKTILDSINGTVREDLAALSVVLRVLRSIIHF